MICYVSFDVCFFFFFKQKTAYEMRISDWSSDVCSSDLQDLEAIVTHDIAADTIDLLPEHPWLGSEMTLHQRARRWIEEDEFALRRHASPIDEKSPVRQGMRRVDQKEMLVARSEEHTSELQSLMRISYAVFSLQKKN